MNNVVKAFRQWQLEDPIECRCDTHQYEDSEGVVHDLPDKQVCSREQAWRYYTKIRDSYKGEE